MSVSCKPVVGITFSCDDSFYQARRLYAAAVHVAGGLPLFLPYELGLDSLSLVDGILLSGGDDVNPQYFGQAMHPMTKLAAPERDEYELAIAKAAYEANKPLLAICRGLQVINIALGGDLIQHIEGHKPDTARGDIAHDTMLSGFFAEGLGVNALPVNSIHHQAIGRLASGLIDCALARDGVIEAAYAPMHPFYVGVQWHPEELRGCVYNLKLFELFISSMKNKF